jgi:hypothetical protein
VLRTRKLALTAFSAVAVTSVGFIAGATLIAASIGSPAAVGGKGTGCGAAGHCSSDSTDAFATWFGALPPYNFANINPSRGSFVSRPRGGPVTITPVQTVVNVQISAGATQVFGCFLVPDSAFVVSRDLQSATLNATLDTPCPAPLTPLLADLQGGGAPLMPALDSTAVSVSVTWTGPGAAFSQTQVFNQHCAGFTSTFQQHGLSSQANATGTVSMPDGTVLALGKADIAGTDSATTVQTSNGTPGTVCLAS